MAKKIGILKETASKTTGEIGYMGRIDVAGMEGACALVPVAHRRSEKSPDYDLKFQRNGRWLDFGVAWLKTPQAGGDEFLSITVDHELLEKAVYVAAFPPAEDDDDNEWHIVWGRSRRGNDRGASQYSVGDEIPY